MHTRFQGKVINKTAKNFNRKNNNFNRIDKEFKVGFQWKKTSPNPSLFLKNTVFKKI